MSAAPTAEDGAPGKNGLATTKNNLRYLIRGPGAAAAPASFTTRSALRTTRYILKFAFWRLLRYMKYTVIAAGTAALAGTTLGAVLPWAGALLVPSVPVAATIGLTTAVIKFGWRHRGNHLRSGWLAGGEGIDPRQDERSDAEEAEREFNRPTSNHRAERAWGTEEFGA